jgi:hypothetical protein
MLRHVVHIVITVPLKVKLTLSVIIKRLKKWPDIKKSGQKNKNQKAVRDIGWGVLNTINMATVREF